MDIAELLNVAVPPFPWEDDSNLKPVIEDDPLLFFGMYSITHGHHIRCNALIRMLQHTLYTCAHTHTHTHTNGHLQYFSACLFLLL